jgi:nitrite reductase/ring-hydroxylating ferredoxin subunit
MSAALFTACCPVYPRAALSEKLPPGAPLGVDILGSRVVLFRDEASGQVYCLDDTCPHRGAPLSQGWLATVTPDAADDEEPATSSSSSSSGGHTCVVCPYHGWAFDGQGKLQDVPSAEPGRWPKRPLVSAYPVSVIGFIYKPRIKFVCEVVWWEVCCGVQRCCMQLRWCMFCRMMSRPRSINFVDTVMLLLCRLRSVAASSGCSGATSACRLRSGRPSPSRLSWRIPHGTPST